VRDVGQRGVSRTSGAGVHEAIIPRQSAPNEAPVVGACGGMGWPTSMAPMQLQQNASIKNEAIH
jgi:hypothetical protein